jgi:hypothetical protein
MPSAPNFNPYKAPPAPAPVPVPAGTPAQTVNLNTGGDTRYHGVSPNDKLQAFIDNLQKPLDMNDPYVQRLVTIASNSASNQARMRGINGPLSVAGVQQAVSDSLAGYDFNRQQLLAQGLATGISADEFDRRLALEKDQYATNRADAYNLNNYQNGQKTDAGWGSVIGGGLGLAAGLLIPGAQPFIPSLVAGGAGLGGLVGGSFAGSAPQPTSYGNNYTPPSSGIRNGRNGAGYSSGGY